MNQHHIVKDVKVEGTTLYMIVDGVSYAVNLRDQSPRLRNASFASLGRVEVSASGYGLHWPEIDEDLSIDGLIGVGHELPRAVAERAAEYGMNAVAQGE